MDIQELTEKAMELRSRLGGVERRRTGREWTKEEIMQGLVVDIGDLMKVVMAKSGIRDMRDQDEKLAHELADCLWSILVLARLYGIDLEKEYLTMIDDVSKRLTPIAKPSQQE